MKIKVSELRRIIREAVADHMRLPKGPNSRDDGDNEPSGQKSEKDNVEE